MLEESKQVTEWRSPELPNKYDIIPVHQSDRSQFKRCRLYWDWTSPARQNLSLRADILGINLPMWFGTGIHYALENYYNPGLKRSPVESFRTWYDIQWNGGLVTEEWLPRVYDLEPENVEIEIPQAYADVVTDEDYKSDVYKVRGLNDILPDPDPAEFEELLHTGTEMMKFYQTYAEKNDDFKVLVAEHDFSVPIWDFETDAVMRAVDVREDSPNHGKVLDVHARGRMDAIWVRKDSGKLGIIDHKTAQQIDENLPVKLETDEQTTTYLWAAEIEAQYYNLPHKGEPLQEVIFNVLRKAYPREPTILQGGMFSVDRTKESTTYDILQQWIARNIPGVSLTEKQRGYVEYLKEVGDEQFIIRKPVRRNRHQLADAGYRLYLEARDMLDPNLRIYNNLRNDYACLGCAFRTPCLAKMDGGDWEQLIRDNYVQARDR
jgi:PD-(D/E)XK nuclease superfamily